MDTVPISQLNNAFEDATVPSSYTHACVHDQKHAALMHVMYSQCSAINTKGLVLAIAMKYDIIDKQNHIDTNILLGCNITSYRVWVNFYLQVCS